MVPNAPVYDPSDLNASNVSDCLKDREAIIYQQGLWGTGPFIRGGTAHLWGPEPTRASGG